MEGPHVDEGLVGGNNSKASLRGRRRLKRERRREQQCMQEGHRTRLNSDEGFLQGELTVSYILE